MHNKKERDYLFDNIKALMLFLVAVGHILDVYIVKSDSFFRYTMQYIYLFHMPVFAFVTGYFSKNYDKQRKKAVKSVLIPYLTIQSLYCLLAIVMIHMGIGSHNSDVFSATLVLPTSPLYYLICVFLWKVFANDIMSLRFPFVMSVIMGCLVSITKFEDWHIGVGATFSLLPFFVLGLKWDSHVVEKIRKGNKILPIAVLVLGVIPSVFLPYRFRNVRFSYSDVGVSNIQGIMYRLLFYAIAIALIVAILALMPRQKNCFSRIGTNAIMVYAGSSFLAPHGYVLLAKFVPVITEDVGINFVCILLYSLMIVYLCSLPFIRNAFEKIQSMIIYIIFQKG